MTGHVVTIRGWHEDLNVYVASDGTVRVTVRDGDGWVTLNTIYDKATIEVEKIAS